MTVPFVLLAVLLGMAAALAVFALHMAVRIDRKLDELHVIVNSRITELLEKTVISSRLEGADIERVAERHRVASATERLADSAEKLSGGDES